MRPRWRERRKYRGIPLRTGTRESLNIGHLTDVSHCKLHQYLCCNREIKCQQSLHGSPQGWPRRATWLSPDRLTPAW